VYGCPPSTSGIKQAQHLNDGFHVPTVTPNKNGGGSAADWKATIDGPDDYIINSEGVVWKLPHGLPESQWTNNKNKWRWDFSGACLAPS
jgi:hypothetical protein